MGSTTPPATLTPVEAFCPTTSLSYLVAGSGDDVIVLLHGWSAFKEIWWSTAVALAQDMRVFAPDLPGHGGSPLLGSTRMSEVAERIGRFCDANGLRSITLAGHSMGGNIALELALQRPDLLKRLVLVAPAAQGTEMPAYTRSYLRRTYGWAALRASMVLYRRLGAIGRYVPHQHGGGLVRPILRRAYYSAQHDPENLRRLLDGLFANPIGPRLAAVQTPTLVISGEYDPLVPPALSRRLAEMLPNGHYVVIPRAAHNPMDERPREFELLLRRFLAGEL